MHEAVIEALDATSADVGGGLEVVQRIAIQPGDTLVLAHKWKLTPAAVERIQAALTPLLAEGCHVVVLEEDMRVAAVLGQPEDAG